MILLSPIYFLTMILANKTPFLLMSAELATLALLKRTQVQRKVYGIIISVHDKSLLRNSNSIIDLVM